MEVKIGVQYAARELVVEYDGTADDVQQAVSAALQGDDGVLTLNDSKGRRIIVPAKKVAYVDIGEQSERKVGFGSV